MATVVEYVVRADTRPAQRGLDKLGDETKEAGRDAKKAQRSFLDMASKVGNAVTGLAAGFGLVRGAIGSFTGVLEQAGRASFDFAHGVVDSVNELNDLNAKSGLSAQAIQAVIQAFEGSGQAAAAADGFISRIPRTFADLAVEGSRASLAAEALGVSLRNSSGQVKSADELLVEISRSFQGIEDDTERATSAFLLFGRSAGQFLQAFGKTAEFEKFLAFTTEFGVQTGPEASQSAATFQELISALNTTFKGTAQRLADSIGLTDTFNNLLLNTIGALVGIQVMIENNQESFNNLGDSVRLLGQGFIDVFALVGTIVGNVLAGIMKSIATTLTSIGILLNALGKTGAAAPFLQAGIGLQGSILALENLGANATGESGSSAFATGKQRAEELMQAIIAGLDDATKKSAFDFDKLTESINKTGDAAENTAKKVDKVAEFFDGTAAAEAKRIDSVIKFENQLTEAFDLDGLDKELVKFDAVIGQLQDNIEFFEELGLSTSKGFGLLNQVLEQRAARVEELAQAEREALAQRASEVFDTVSGVFSAVLGGGLSAFGNVLQAASPAIEQGVSSLATSLLSTLGVASAGPMGAVVGQLAGQVVSTIGQTINQALSALQGLGTFRDEAGARARARKISEEQGITFAKALEEERRKEIANELQQQTDAIKLGLQILPELLFETLPPILNEFLIEFGQLLFELPDRLREAFVRAITVDAGLDSDASFADQAKAFFEFFTFSMSDGEIRAPGFAGGQTLVSAQGGIRFTGADQGLAMLHRGEFVVPETNIAPQAVSRRLDREVGGGGVTINVNADVVERSAIDELVNRIEQRFLTFGGNTSPLFGGT